MKQNVQIDCRLVRQIKPSNLLSFGPNTPALKLENLNVLIGPNGSGKSNLIEAVALMRATPVLRQTSSNGDVRGVLRRGGGAHEWVWKGALRQPASVELVVNNPKGKQPLRHLFAFRGDSQGFQLHDEQVENETPYADQTEAYFYYRFQEGHPVVKTAGHERRKLARETVDLEQSFWPSGAIQSFTLRSRIWQKCTSSAAYTASGSLAEIHYSVNRKKPTCVMIVWRRISPTSGFF